MKETAFSKQLASLKTRIDEREASRIVQLPFWPEPVRGTPNAFLRSALFPAIHGRNRQYLKREFIASQKGVSVRFSGMQLDQSDLDVWEQAVHLARKHPLGTTCHFSAYSFLKSLGRSTGKSQHEWLKDAVARLAACAIEISDGCYTYGGGLVQEFFREEESGLYKLILNKKLLNLYEAGYTGLQWDDRRLLGRKPLALWLFSYYSTHENPHPVKVETLQRLSGSSTAQTKHFKRNLKKALLELQLIGFICNFSIDRDGLVFANRR